VLCLIPRLAIITEIIAPYRIPVFNALALRPELELNVIFLSENDPGLRQWQVYKDEIKFNYEVLPSWRRRCGQHNVLINRGVLAALNRINPDALLCGGYNYVATWEAAVWSRLHGVPLLLWSESTALDSRHGSLPVEFMKTVFLRMCRAFVVAGRTSFGYVNSLGIQADRIFIAPNAVDTQLFAALAETARRQADEVRVRHALPSRYFLYAGRMVREKGIFDLLEAYAQLSPRIRAEVGLVFVGDGADRTELMELASRVAPGTIRFPGFIQRESLPEFYAMADALIFPTHSDPWGLVVNEAMSCGLPVVASSVAGCIADLIRDGWNGFVIAPEHPSQLASAMSRLADDSELRAQMGSRSRQRIAANSPQAWAEGTLAALKFVCPRMQ